EAAEVDAMPRLREVCGDAKFRGDPDAEARYARIQRDRSCRIIPEPDGAVSLQAKGAPVEMARFEAELRRLTDLEFRHARTQGKRESLEKYRYDALMAMGRRSAQLDGAAAAADAVAA